MRLSFMSIMTSSTLPRSSSPGAFHSIAEEGAAPQECGLWRRYRGRLLRCPSALHQRLCDEHSAEDGQHGDECSLARHVRLLCKRHGTAHVLTHLRVLGREQDELGPGAAASAGPPGMARSPMNFSSVGGLAYIIIRLRP